MIMAEEKQQFRREVAKRMFIKELAAISLSYKKDEGDQAPTYYLSPTGCEANRVLLVGVITDVDDIGTEKPYYRARITDSTGEIYVYAGEYNPEAAGVLADMEIPEYVAIIGKVNIYTPEDGDESIISLRAERIAIVDEHTKDLWEQETAKQTDARIESMLHGELNEVQQQAASYYEVDLAEFGSSQVAPAGEVAPANDARPVEQFSV